MYSPAQIVAFVLVLIIALLAGFSLAREYLSPHPPAHPPVLYGGSEAAPCPVCPAGGGRAETVFGGRPDESDPRAVAGARHPMGAAIHEYAQGLDAADNALSHPLDRDHYTAPATGGSKTPAKKAKKPWAEYATWDELQKDEGAVAAYMAQRTAAITDPNFDWSPVLAAMRPKLAENREYIGVVNVSKDGHTLHITQSEASPTVSGETDSETSFASIPASLVETHGSRPGLFLFHTHPDDLRCCQFPSSHDLAAAIHFGVSARFAANAVISRYGVFVYGVDWSAYKSIKAASDPQLAKLNYSHDVVAAHESTRSWSTWTIPEYLAFYPRHRMFINSYPSPKLIGDSRRYSYIGDLELPVDHELITDHISDINAHQKGRARERHRGTKSQKATTDAALLDVVDDTRITLD